MMMTCQREDCTWRIWASSPMFRLCRLAKRRPDGQRFFVMRLQYGTGLYTRRGHEIELRGILPQEEGEAKEMGVLVGKQARQRKYRY